MKGKVENRIQTKGVLSIHPSRKILAPGEEENLELEEEEDAATGMGYPEANTSRVPGMFFCRLTVVLLLFHGLCFNQLSTVSLLGLCMASSLSPALPAPYTALKGMVLLRNVWRCASNAF